MLRIKTNKCLILGNGGIVKTAMGSFCGDTNTGYFLTGMHSLGFNVTYCSHKVNSKRNSFLYQFNLDNAEIQAVSLHGRRPRSYMSLLKLAVLLLTHKHIYIFYPGGYSRNAARLCRVLRRNYGVYVRGFGLTTQKLESPRGLQRLTDTWLLERAKYLITVSDSLAVVLKKYNQKIDIIKPMLNWTLDDVLEKEIKNKSCWNLLFVGSIIEQKGIRDLLSIAGLFNKMNISFSMNIIGDGDIYEEIKMAGDEAQIPKNVFFRGSVIDKCELEKYYEISDAFIFPSWNEGFPRVLYEAMLKSLPIFTTMVGGIPGLMKDGYNCIEIPLADCEKQVEVILKTMQDAEKLKEITTNGVKTVRSVLTMRHSHHCVLSNYLTKW